MPIYQQILTFLLQTYRAKYLLQRTRLQDIYVFNDARLKQQCLMLRNQLIWISDILRSYLTETVIAQCTSAMTAAMEKAQDIDEMANIHIKYLARLQEQAILSDALNPIHRAIISILDLAVLFHDTHKRSTQSSKSPLPKPTSSDRKPVPQKPKPKLKKRKSILPSVVEDMRDDDESDSERDDVENEDAGDGPQVQAMQKVPSSFEGDIKTIETELNRLLPFLSAGLRNIGRVGAEPVWEMLAERLEWRGRDAESVMR
jgi:gamma-tubulin complex component 5